MSASRKQQRRGNSPGTKRSAKGTGSLCTLGHPQYRSKNEAAKHGRPSRCGRCKQWRAD